MNSTDHHTKSIHKINKEITDFRKKIKSFSMLKLPLFFLTCIGVYFLWGISISYAFILINICVILFFFIMIKESKLNKRIIFHENHKGVHELEIKLSDHQFDGLDTGEQFQKHYHSYSHDLDIFGKNSIFQLLNRTCTYYGAEILANELNSPPLERKVILNRQLAVKELSHLENWCHRFLAFGKGNSNKKGTKETIMEWLDEKDHFSSTFMRILSITLPLITVLVIISCVLNIIPWVSFSSLFLFQLIIAALYTSKVNIIHNKLGRKYAMVDKYLDLIKSIEKQDFQSSLLINYKKNFIDDDRNIQASKTLQKLKKLLDVLDTRLNIYIAVVLNGVLLWDINASIRVEKWKTNNKEELKKWISTIGEIDALISIAIFAASHYDYSYPEFIENDFKLSATGLGHPLINKNKLVKNDYNIEGLSKVDLLTGANMAGKSTFLRTVGVNMVLARIGSPVCAESFSLKPIKIFSSLRTIDSLQDDESFFYAELKRLQTLIKLYSEGEEYFFILDEILKGTNSTDQHKGSVGLIKKIISLGGVGIIATHDLGLSDLEIKLPDHVRNICFEIEIIENELKFDYQLKSGFCRTMNASFLMEVMNII